MTGAPPMPEHWDAVIIGAGVAGAACAVHLKRRAPDLRVLLVERSRWPRQKVCGGCINRAGVEMLEDMGVLETLHKYSVPLDSVEFRRAGRDTLIPHAGGRAIARTELDAALVRLAVGRGACFSPETSAHILDRTPDGFWRIALQNAHAPRTHSARMVLAADGLGGSCLRSLTGFSVRIARRAWMGVGAILEPSIARPLWPDLRRGVVRMCSHTHGYVGLVRLADGSIDIAAALHPRWTRDRGGPLGAMRTILASSAVADEIPTAALVLGCGLLTRHRDQIAAPGLLVIGDAAGYVEPFTGEGMTWALASADLSAAITAHALRSADGEALSAAAARWTAIHAATILPRQRHCGAIRGLMRTPGVLPALLALARASPAVRGAMQRVGVGISRPYTSSAEAA